MKSLDSESAALGVTESAGIQGLIGVIEEVTLLHECTTGEGFCVACEGTVSSIQCVNGVCTWEFDKNQSKYGVPEGGCKQL